MTLSDWLDEQKKEIHLRLDSLTQTSDPHLSPLFEAARYSLLSGGKRIRPLLTLSVLKSFGANPHVGLDPACALEMVHTYSLIHDDLPCMDDDDLRRGRPTLHKVYPEGHAVLTGDFLLTYAFEVIEKSPHLKVETRLQLIRELAKRAGAQGIIGGQLMDLSLQTQTRDWPFVEKMHLYKTGSLIQCALLFGGIVAGVSGEDLDRLERLGAQLGLGFQIIDDLLDVFGEESLIGKKVGSDCAKNKLTALSIYEAPRCHQIVQELKESARQTVDQLNGSHPLLNALIDLSLARST